MGCARRWVGLVVGALAVVSSASPAEAAEGARGGMFVLPIERAWPVSESAGTVFEERLAISLAEAKRVRPLGPRDIPPARRGGLPKELAACVTPACLRRLAEATTAERVLGIKLADDEGRPTLFATVYEARTGEIVLRKEWPGRRDDPPVGERLAGEVARWAASLPRPGEPAPPAPPPPPRFVWRDGVVALDLAPGEPESQQAGALLGALAARLSERRGFSVIPRGGAGVPSHRAVVKIENVNVTHRPHHLEHVREGSLDASVTITDLPSGLVVFVGRGQADAKAKARHTNDAEVMGALVTDVVAQWMNAFDALGVAE